MSHTPHGVSVMEPSPPREARESLTLKDPFLYLRRWEKEAAGNLGLIGHFLEPLDSTANRVAAVDGRELLCFSAYNYLGLSGDPRVNAAAKAAIDEYGTSVSASRLVAGERPVHRALERELASFLHAEDALVFVSGHATNVTTLGSLCGPDDLIFYDILSHNSILEGIRLSGARSLPFPHNNVRALESLILNTKRGRRVLIVTEGAFSMDGDLAPLPELVELRNRHNAFLMVDEAHSLGVVGPTGGGVREHFQLRSSDVDIWMGTLSKSLASCGGYIAGSSSLIDSLRNGAPGFIYSCGMTPPNAAAALASLEILQREPERVERLRSNVSHFRQRAGEAGLNTGQSGASAIVPVILGSSLLSVAVAHRLYEAGILVHPLFYPVVPERSSRLRFFLTSMHRCEDIDRTIASLSVAIEDARRLFDSLPADLSQRLLNVSEERHD